MPDLSKLTKAERIEKVVFIYCGYLALNPFQTQTLIFKQGLLLKNKMTIFSGSKHVL
jgi:hypothetical protein